MIGIFDSGVGGLTVVKEIFKTFPGCQITYFGDTARLPYGTKGSSFVKKYSAKITEWLLGKGAKIIVIACHTSSAQAGEFLRDKFKGVPIFDMINPCSKELADYKKIGIIGTPGTINSKAWEKHILNINPNIKIQLRSCPLFVPLVEEGWTNNKAAEEITREYLGKFNDIEALILACTHYPMLEKTIKKVIKADIINPAEYLVEELKNQNQEIGESKFYFSDQPYNLNKISEFCFDKQIKPIINDPF